MNVKRKSQFSICGILLDPARLTERHEFYFELLPQLARWGYNTIIWHFSDDEGFALKLKSHPELASPYAFTKSKMRKFIKSATDVGIDIIPEVESLGHSLFLTGLPQYAHLLDGDPFDHNAICPSHWDTLPLLKEIIDEVIELFPSPYFHVGLDEADLTGCKRCSRRSLGKQEWFVFSEHVSAIHEIITAHGKRVMMWADSVEKQPALLGVLPKDIILLHWQYQDVGVRPERIIPSIDAGFEVVCVPKMCGGILQPDEAEFKNMDVMTQFANRCSSGCLGLVTCWWEPARNLRDTYPLSAAYAGYLFSTGRISRRVSFTNRFIKRYFGLTDSIVAKALWDLHKLVLSRSEMKSLFPNDIGQIYEAVNFADGEDFVKSLDDIEHCITVLKSARRNVKYHNNEYNAYIFSAQLILTSRNNGLRLSRAAHIYRAAAFLREQKVPRSLILKELSKITEILHKMKQENAELNKVVSMEWDRTRYSRDKKKDGSSKRIRQRGDRILLPELQRCSSFLELLLKQYKQALSTYRKHGIFPGGI